MLRGVLKCIWIPTLSALHRRKIEVAYVVLGCVMVWLAGKIRYTLRHHWLRWKSREVIWRYIASSRFFALTPLVNWSLKVVRELVWSRILLELAHVKMFFQIKASGNLLVFDCASLAWSSQNPTGRAVLGKKIAGKGVTDVYSSCIFAWCFEILGVHLWVDSKIHNEHNQRTPRLSFYHQTQKSFVSRCITKLFKYVKVQVLTYTKTVWRKRLM